MKTLDGYLILGYLSDVYGAIINLVSPIDGSPLNFYVMYSGPLKPGRRKDV